MDVSYKPDRDVNIENLNVSCKSIFIMFQKAESRNVTAVDTLLDLARNLFPPNLVQVNFDN